MIKRGGIRYASPMEAFDARVNLICWFDTEGARRWLRWQLPDEDEIDEQARALRGEHFPGQAVEQARLRLAELYWTSPDLTELAVAATESFPSSPLRREELPTPNGFVLFARDVYLEGGDEEREGEVTIGIHWFERPGAVDILAYQDADFFANIPLFEEADDRMKAIMRESIAGLGSPLLPLTCERHEFGKDTPQTYGKDEEGILRGNGAYMRGLRAWWALTRQRLATTTTERPQRGSVRRAVRAGVGIPTVQVVHLRQSAFRDDAVPGEPTGPVDWKYRWIVGAHWRDQFHPGCHDCVARRKACGAHPTWIAPYIKGPENKPLVADRMYSVDR